MYGGPCCNRSCYHCTFCGVAQFFTYPLIYSSIDTAFQLPELSQFAVGLMHIQLLHTSASLAINENWDPDVRDDMEMMLNRIAQHIQN